RQLTVLRSFTAPSAELIADNEAFLERVSASVSGLLALLGVDADPIQSREFILLTNILDVRWRAGESVDLPGLIRDIQKPPMTKVGFLDLESFYPQKERFGLAMKLNNLLASPSFATWMEGEPLDIQKLMFTAEGKPRLSIISIAHLDDRERMFFVTLLLNEVLAWMRTQPGSASLRAMLYMDEVFGYFPPTANPPSKKPMLTLLKQARAFGLGVVLATQNPVDLDYKGLSNCGTWFLGRLQTERDKARVLDGLEGASSASGVVFDRGKMEATLAGLGSRKFLLHNVHEDEPTVFQTRWALSYLRGPLTRSQISTLMADKIAALPKPPVTAAPDTVTKAIAEEPPAEVEEQPPARPVLPAEANERFLAPKGRLSADDKLIYRPAVLAISRVHFVRVTYKIDSWIELGFLKLLASDSDPGDWGDAEKLDLTTFDFKLDTDDEPDSRATFTEPPACVTGVRAAKKWPSEIDSHIYQTETLPIFRCDELKEYSNAGESEGDFRARLRQILREERDLQLAKLKKSFDSKLKTIRNRLETARERVEREQSQYRSSQMQTAISFGTSVLGALFGRKLASTTNVNKAGTAMRGVSRTMQQGNDVTRAKRDVADAQQELADLEQDFSRDVEAMQAKLTADNLEFEQLAVRPRKSDIDVEQFAVIWTPWRVDSAGMMQRLF
ncbi:MAG: ATP-binding protein, partial [bacterium]|nr:ATP-binding protein [bacterium]